MFFLRDKLYSILRDKLYSILRDKLYSILKELMDNLLVSGIVLSSDKYGRIRLFIDTNEITKIINSIKQDNYVKFPFEGGKIDKSGSVLIITLKKNHKEFWLKKIEEYRSNIITIETSLRKWKLNGQCGIALDLNSII